MLRQPGPIPPLDLSWYPTTWDTPDFTPLTTSALQEADNIFLSMDSVIDPAMVFDDLPTGDTIMYDLDAVDKINGDSASLAGLQDIPTIDGMKKNGDDGLVAAIQCIPGEAFQPVPAQTQWGSAAPTAPTAVILSVNITDQGGAGHGAFLVGDQYQVVVQMDMNTGSVNDYFQVHVYAEVQKDGVPQVNFEFPDTDHTGSTTHTGQWQSTDVGNWSMTVHAVPLTGGNVQNYGVTWSVTATSTPRPVTMPSAVKVQLINWTTQDLTNSHSGDTWQLFVSGPPNSDVNMWATYNGQALQEVTLGQTDSFGNYTIADKWHDTEIGEWTEHYAVGRFQQVGSLSFTIKPAGA